MYDNVRMGSAMCRPAIILLYGETNENRIINMARRASERVLRAPIDHKLFVEGWTGVDGRLHPERILRRRARNF